MMPEKVATAATGRKSGLSIVGEKEGYICGSGASAHISLFKHAMLDFIPFNDRGVWIASR